MDGLVRLCAFRVELFGSKTTLFCLVRQRTNYEKMNTREALEGIDADAGVHH